MSSLVKTPKISIEPSEEKHKPIFFITWESTLKCNLDCTYCHADAHNNAIPHPSLEDCLETVDFLLEYTNLYMQTKPLDHRHVSMNIFGGESLFHPNLVEILDYMQTQHKKANFNWTMGLSTITNAIVKPKIWNKLLEYIDYYTISYHSEVSEEQENLFKENALALKHHKKNFNCSILMYSKHWDKCINMIEWCKKNDIPHLIRQLDHWYPDDRFFYTVDQAKWFSEIRGIDVPIVSTQKPVKKEIPIVNLDLQGRSCCGGNPLHVDKDYSCSQTYIPNNNFQGWSCSVNYFFVFIKQVTKEVWTNKDCRMNYDGKYGPIGTLDQKEKIISELKERLSQGPISITCSRKRCWCGLCTPKAADKETYTEIMKKYLI